MVNDSDNEGEEHFGNGFHEKPSSPNAYVNEGFSDFPLTCTPVVSQNDVSAVYEENPKIKQVGLRSILNYARWWDYIFLVVAIFASIGLGIGMPLLIILFGDIIDEMIEPGTEDFLNQTNAFKQFEDTMTDVCLQITYVGLGVLLVAYFQIAYITLFGENILYRIRCDSFKAVIRQEIAWFDYQKTGLLVTKLAENMETIRIGVSDKIAIAIQHLTTFVAGFVIAFMYNAEFAGVLCVLIPFMLVAGIGMAKASESVASEEQVEHGDAGALAESTFSAIRTVIAFGGEKRAIKRYDECLSKAKYKAASKTIIIGAFLGFVFLVEFLGYGLAFWYGPRLVVDGELKGGEMMTVFFCVLVGSLSLGQGITAFISVWSVRGAMSYIQFIMNRVPLIDSETDKGVKLDSIKGEMHFSNINFCYPSRRDVPVLKNFNLTVKPGQKVALVGASGSGKSTIVNLIQRFYEYNNGSITLDGRDLKELNVKWLREQIGVVSQEPSLFACSIKENIQYGREGVTDDEIKDALEKANAKNFIDKLPNGLDTVVGDRGSQLSGGQKQRVAIARALVRNPKILLLDEATSALDSSSESVVQEALDKASAGRTTLIVAHRLSTIRDADLIVAMEHGQVVEMGTHSELLNKHGLYANLVTAQTLSETDSQEADEDLDQVECVEDTEGNEANHVVYNRRDEVAVHIKDGGTLDPDLVPESPKKKKTGGKKDKKEKEETPGFLDIMRLNAPEWYLLLIACIFAIPAAGGIPIYGIFFAEIIEVFALPADEIQEEANFWAGMFCVLGCAVGFGIFFESVFLGLSGARLTQRLRSNSFKQILRQDMTFFDKEENYVGQLTTRLTKETAQIQGASGFRLKAIVEATVGLLTGLVIAFIFGWQLAFLVLGMIPFIGLSAGLQLKFASGFAVTGKDAEKGEARIISESISNIRTVQSLNLETQLSKLFVSYLTETHKKNLIMAHVFGVAQCVSQGMFFFVFAACFRFAAWLVVEDQISFSDAFRVIFSLVFAAYGVGQSMSVVPDYDKAKNSALSVTKLLKLRSNIDNLSHEGEQLKKKVEEIEFRDVHFRYPSRPKVKILRGLNLSIKKGTTVALVGASGCGKSTVMQLLQRFYDPEHGEVLMDGQNIKHLNVQDLRKKMAIVSQEPTLFNASISDNIRYGALADNGDFDPSLVYSDVEAAAKKANMWTYDYVLSLPEKLETNVGDKGTQLSGGQKQRVAIARALLRNPEILLLDEATSALDSRSEKLVQTAIDEARVGRTCLVIAHRLTTIQAADEIVVMDQGHVAERGTHEKLIAQGGLYKQFCDAQSLK